MGRLARRSSRRFLRCWLASLCALLLGLALVSLAQPPVAAAAASPALLAPMRTHTATPTATTSTPRASATPGGARAAGSETKRAPSWLPEALGIMLLLLLGFGLIIVPLALRAARIERRHRPAYSPAPMTEDEQVARLSQIAPERKEPLSREQLRALREAARESADLPPQPTASLPTVRIIKGVPVSLPDVEAEPLPQLPAPPQPAATRASEGSAESEKSYL
jgi:hypothetical protein